MAARSKVVVLGPSEVGKSTFCHWLQYREFSQTLGSTIGAAFLTIHLPNGDINIWDTAGKERYRSIVPMYIRGECELFLIFFDAQNPSSFESFPSFQEMLANVCSSRVIIVINKADSLLNLNPDNNYPYEKAKKLGEDLATRYGYSLRMISSKNGYGMDALLQDLQNCVGNTSHTDAHPQPVCKKPVIYCYPPHRMDISVKLELSGKLLHTYPKPLLIEEKEGICTAVWDIVGEPNGGMIYKGNNREYDYLFWEGTENTEYDFSKGFIVKGEDTCTFLEEKLTILGLNRNELNEFIIYWMPLLESNEYNFLTFQTERYTDKAKLIVTPTPDHVIRVYMTAKKINQPFQVQPQDLQQMAVDRTVLTGFTVVEWGGDQIE